jgi:hypothetical protein
VRRQSLAHSMRARIGWSIFGLTSVAMTGCGGHTDSAVPPATLSRNVAGVWRRTQIGIEGNRVSCPDPKELLAPNTRDLTVNNVVVDTCGSKETLVFGTSTSRGRGRYRLTSLRGTEDGSYVLTGSTLTLVRDAVNGTYLRNLIPSQVAQRTVYSVVLDGETMRFTPTSQPVGLTKKDSSQPAFREDGTLIASNLTPILNADGTVNTITLPGVNDVAVVNSDLSITVGPLATSGNADDTPGLVRVRGVENSYQFDPDPADPIPTPLPAPSAP